MPSVGEWVKELWCIHTMEYFLAVNENEILPFATALVDLKGIMLREISQMEKDKNRMISLLCGA